MEGAIVVTRAQSDVELIGRHPLSGLTAFSRCIDHAVDQTVHRVRAARTLSLLIAGLGAGFLWDLAAEAARGQVRLLATGAPLVLCVAAYAYRRRRPPAGPKHEQADRPQHEPSIWPKHQRQHQQVHRAEREPEHQPELDFVPLATYWTGAERADELAAFLDATDDVQERLRETLSFVFGDELTAATRLQDLDVAAAEFGVWSRSDSQRWRRCLRLRRNIMAEGVEPTTGAQVCDETAWLVAASRRLAERARPPAQMV